MVGLSLFPFSIIHTGDHIFVQTACSAPQPFYCALCEFGSCIHQQAPLRLSVVLFCVLSSVSCFQSHFKKYVPLSDLGSSQDRESAS